MTENENTSNQPSEDDVDPIEPIKMVFEDLQENHPDLSPKFEDQGEKDN